jgi:hypothetical protein
VKRAALLKRIKAEAKRRGIVWVLDREGGRHTVYLLGGSRIPIPRHVEIDDNLAERIFRECEPELGERWWKP